MTVHQFVSQFVSQRACLSLENSFFLKFLGKSRKCLNLCLNLIYFLLLPRNLRKKEFPTLVPLLVVPGTRVPGSNALCDTNWDTNWYTVTWWVGSQMFFLNDTRYSQILLQLPCKFQNKNKKYCEIGTNCDCISQMWLFKNHKKNIFDPDASRDSVSICVSICVTI